MAPGSERIMTVPRSFVRLFFALALMAAVSALPGTSPAASSVQAQAAGSGASSMDIFSQSREFQRMLELYRENTNQLLLTVDGEPITVESLRSEIGSFEARINQLALLYSGVSRENLELRLLLSEARKKAVEIIMVREATLAKLDAVDSEVDAAIEEEMKQLGIDPSDFEAWAQFTLQYTNKTPLEYREIKSRQMKAVRVQRIMAGFHGPLPGLKLPIFFPLKVTPKEVFDEYLRIRDRWYGRTNLNFSAIGLRWPKGYVGAGVVQALAEQVKDAHAQARRGVSLEAIQKSLQDRLDQLISDIKADPAFPTDGSHGRLLDLKVLVERDRKVEKENELTSLERSLLRTLRKGDVSEIGDNAADSFEGREYESSFFILLHSFDEGAQRQFVDMDVQVECAQIVEERKREFNLLRVQRVLVQRAVVVPQGMKKLLFAID